MRTIALCLLIACGHAGSPPLPPPPVATPPPPGRDLAADCKRALSETPSPTLTPEQRTHFDAMQPARDALERVCIEDQWPAAVTTCFAAATPEHPAGACMEGLTDAQIDHIQRAYAKARPK